MTDPTVYINGRFLGQPLTGVQRVAAEMVRALSNVDGGAPTLLVPRNVDCGALRCRPVGRYNGHLWEQLELPPRVGGGLLVSLCNTAPILVKNQVVLIHDTGAFTVPGGYSWKFRKWYGLMQRRLVQMGVRIATVSMFSKQEIITQLGASPDQVTVLGAGADHMCGMAAEPDILARAGLTPGRFVLAVGSLAPHKNLTALEELARRLRERSMTLAITGGVTAGVFGQQAAGVLPDLCSYVGRVSDGQLKALYQSAACYVFPSRYEGFGLPAIEAMACGCPVVAAGIFALRESCGSAAIYCDPDRPSDIAEQVLRFVEDGELRGRYRELGRAQAALHTWARSARLLQALIGESVRSHRGTNRRKISPAV